MIPSVLVLAALFASAAPSDPTAGQILVSTEKSTDPDFGKAVVLLVHSDERGAIGLMLNRPTEVPLSRVFPAVKDSRMRSQTVYFGGPVAVGARALIRHPAASEGMQKLFGEVWVTADSALIAKLLETGLRPDVFRVYAGYTGWSAIQLRNEVRAGLWKVIPGDARVVFASHPDLLWPLLNR